MSQYSQFKAMFAVMKASLQATFRSPQSIFFSLFFPIVLIWIFGSLAGGGGIPTVDVAWEKNVDSTNILYQLLAHTPSLKFADPKKKNMEDELTKGRITAAIGIEKMEGPIPYQITLRTSQASQREMAQLQPILRYVTDSLERVFHQNQLPLATIKKTEIPGRRYKMIDFFLPGMIGFSLIGAAVFGIAFLFYSLRETLVLKRMYATPIQRGYIILGESISKVIFQLTTVVVLIAFGHFMYGFYLANGVVTFLNMLILSFLGLLVFMGFGFLISGLAKNQNVIPIYANLFMFPQYFLSGTFFPKTALPAGIQPLLQFLPLTALNDSLRNVAFEGSSLWSCWPQMLIMLVWGVVVYAITAKFFRWE
ncbi:MAG: ABC transporter permease [Chitinophagaceae bacterium]|nr:MAG: ABC transporter permease [Chitinophagaceae bacterium]